MNTPAPPRMTRRPGLFRRWELREQLGLPAAVHFEEDGAMADGTVLWAIYDVKVSDPSTPSAPPIGEWVRLPGAYRASEFQLPENGGDWHLEDLGPDAQGETLYRVHHRLRRVGEPSASASAGVAP